MEQTAHYRSHSTAANYATAIRTLERFLAGRKLPLSQLDANLMGAFERWMLSQGIRQNTTSCYLRSLRALLIDYDPSLSEIFAKVYTGKARTDKRSIPMAAIAQLQKMELPAASYDALARDVFLFSFYAMGMPFVDVAHLRRSQVSGNTFAYNRQKTGQRIVVNIEPPMQVIMDRYASRGDYVFPLLSGNGANDYDTALGRYNRALRRLASKAGIKEKLTSYVVRHSWASAAYRENIDLPVISRALGHGSTQTTLVYLREVDNDTLAEASRHMVKSVLHATEAPLHNNARKAEV